VPARVLDVEIIAREMKTVRYNLILYFYARVRDARERGNLHKFSFVVCIFYKIYVGLCKQSLNHLDEHNIL